MSSGDGDDHGPLDSGELWEHDPVDDNSINSHLQSDGSRSFVIDHRILTWVMRRRQTRIIMI